MALHKGISIRIKVFLLMGGLSLLALLGFMAISVDLFNRDKTSFVYQTNALVTQTLSTQVKAYFKSIFDLADVLDSTGELKPVKSFHAYETSGRLQSILKKRQDLVYAKILNTTQKNQLIEYHGEGFIKTNGISVNIVNKVAGPLAQYDHEVEALGVAIHNVSLPSLPPMIFVGIKKDTQLMRFVFELAALVNLFSQVQEFTTMLIGSGREVLCHSHVEEIINRKILSESQWMSEIRDSKIATAGREFNENQTEPFIATYDKLGIGGLIVISQISKARAFLASQLLIEKTVLFGAFFVFASLLAAILFSRGITKNIRILFEAIQKLRKGDFKTKIKLNASDEIGHLSKAFNEMAIDLALHVEEIKKVTAQKQKVRDTFARYVSPNVVDQVLQAQEGLKRGGERKEITMFFSDVRDFTAISEKLNSNQISDMLNRYMNKMTDIVFEKKGTLDKYIGDAIVALWGAPIEFSDHAYWAVKAGSEMIEAMPALNEELKSLGYPEFNIGIGINSGEVALGNMGSERIFTYTALGDNMNLACRLESLCKYYQSKMIISEFTYKALGDRVKEFCIRTIDYAQVKGKKLPVYVMEVLDSSHSFFNQFDDLLLYEEAYRLMIDLKAAEAHKIFEELQLRHPNDPTLKRLLQKTSVLGFNWSPLTVHDKK